MPAMSYLNCPRCHLSLPAPGSGPPKPEYCPRCLGRSGVAAHLFSSALTMRELTTQPAVEPEIQRRTRA